MDKIIVLLREIKIRSYTPEPRSVMKIREWGEWGSNPQGVSTGGF